MLRKIALLALIACVPSHVSAQIASSSVSALGMGENATAGARGYEALAWNPAGLVMRGSGTATGTLLTLRAGGGAGPVTLSDLLDDGGTDMPAETRQAWLNTIRAEGSQDARAQGDIVWAAMHSGYFGLSASTSFRGAAHLTGGGAELFLDGATDEDGNPKDLDLTGSSLGGTAYTMLAAALAYPVDLTPDVRLSLGAAGKWGIGHALFRSLPSAGQVSEEGGSLQMPVAYSRKDAPQGGSNLKSGGGFSLDVGAGLDMGPFALGVAMQNVVNQFAWDEDKFLFRPIDFVLSREEGANTDTEPRPLAEAPEEVVALVRDATFARSTSVGLQYRPSSRVRLSADYRTSAKGALHTRPAQHLGAGIEVWPLNFVALQAGASRIGYEEGRDGRLLSAGIAFRIKSFSLAAAVAQSEVGGLQERTLMLTLLSHRFADPSKQKH